MNSIRTTFKNTTIVKIIDNVLSKIGFIGSMEHTHIDTFTENRINNIKCKLIAESNDGKIWFEQQEYDSLQLDFKDKSMPFLVL